MRAADVIDAPVAGDARNYLHAHALVVIADHPCLASQVEVAENIDAERTDVIDWTGSYNLQQRIAGGAVSVFLRALESLRMYGEYGNSFFQARAFADRFDIVANDADDA